MSTERNGIDPGKWDISDGGSADIDPHTDIKPSGSIGDAGNSGIEKDYGLITRAIKTGGSPAYNPWL